MSIFQPAYCRQTQKLVMKARSFVRGAAAIIPLVLFTLSTVPLRAGLTNLYEFSPWPSAQDGSYPLGTLLRDASGALYGVTWFGGQYGYGTIFRMSPPVAGQTQWSLSVLYSFRGGSDGSSPNPILAMDSAGAIYGTAADDGSALEGVAFKLTPPVNESSEWNYTVLHTFAYNRITGNDDGAHPSGGLIIDRNGALYGTTNLGGVTTDPYYSGFGTVFKLTPIDAQRTTWQETVLYRFQSISDGQNPMSVLTLNSAGVLYGSTMNGGTGSCTNWYGINLGCGTVFQLIPPAPGQTTWTKSTLHSFAGGVDGVEPQGKLLQDTYGALYGTTTYGGTGVCPDWSWSNVGCGIVYKLTPPSYGQSNWTKSTLHSFTGPDGAFPQGGVIMEANGALFGTASGGGPVSYGLVGGYGLVFKLAPPPFGGSAWTQTVLHFFDFSTNGELPIGELISDPAGRLFGVTNLGGPNGAGTIYEITP